MMFYYLNAHFQGQRVKLVWVNRVVSVESKFNLQILWYKHFMTMVFILISHRH